LRLRLPISLVCLAVGIASISEGATLRVPASIEAGSAFSVQCGGTGKGTLYIVGPDQFIRRDVELGTDISFPPGTLYNAGRYSLWLESGGSSETGSLDVLPAAEPSELTFIAKPSRLQVALPNGITGTVYVFDTYRNLIIKPLEVSFDLSTPETGTQTRTMETRNGAAWTQMDSTRHEGKVQFIARAGDVSSKRVIFQVPGEPCSLKMSAKSSGDKIHLITEPVRDCSGNAVPDGTIVTFTELSNGAKATVDVPLKKGIASVEMPAHRGAIISVASGVVLGNQIRWGQ
jgi:hypothetical protein